MSLICAIRPEVSCTLSTSAFETYHRQWWLGVWSSTCMWGRELPQGPLIIHDSSHFYLGHICVSKVWFCSLGKAKEAPQLYSRRHVLLVISGTASLSMVRDRVSADGFCRPEYRMIKVIVWSWFYLCLIDIINYWMGTTHCLVNEGLKRGGES